MLKELWQKAIGIQAVSASSQGAQNKEFRILPHMTHTGEFHLERLTQVLEGRYGRTFEGNSDESIRELIQFAARIQDQDVQRELLLFYLNCSPIIQEFLRSDGTFGSDHFLSR